MRKQKGARGVCLLAFFFVFTLVSSLVFFVRPSYAICVTVPCSECNGAADTIPAVNVMNIIEDLIWEPIIEENIEDHLNSEENWIVEEFFEDFWVVALAELTEYLGAFGMYQVEMVGAFFDAKNHLETTRLYNQLQAEAHKDYYPSESFCTFGTNVRSMAGTESRSKLNMVGLSQFALERQLGATGSGSGENSVQDKKNRWNKFVSTYCDPRDNGWVQVNTGLDLACDRDGVDTGSAAAGATDPRRINRDVDYTQLIDLPRTLEVDFTAPTAGAPDAEDVLALAANLYGNTVPTRRFSANQLGEGGAQRIYLNLRSMIAKRNVAQNSFNAIVAMKASGSSSDTDGDTETFPTGASINMENHQTNRFMNAVLRDLMPSGMSASDAEDEIEALLGENPSYYAQLEVLAKKIYQNPDFFANLYDTPTNVERKGVAMKAIDLMLDRALFESELRQEMLMSVMLANEVSTHYNTINRDLTIE